MYCTYKVSLISIFLFLASVINAQEINWLSLEGALNQASAGKKVMIILEDPDNPDCKSFNSRSLSRGKVIQILNSKFAATKINYKKQSILDIKNVLSSFSSSDYSGLDQLSKKLKSGEAKLPLIFIFDENWQIIQKFENYKSPLEFEKIIQFFGNDFYKKVPWTTFDKNYQQ